MQRHSIVGEIEGLAPLLFSRMRPEALSGTGGAPTTEQLKEEPTRRLHLDDQRGAYIPGEAFKLSLLEGCRRGKVKNGMANFATLFEATLFPDDDLFLGKDTYDDVFDHWGHIPPGPKGKAVMLHYPRFRVGWRAPFSLTIWLADEKLSIERLSSAVRRGLDAAGLLVGVGSWRPEYGRFYVRDFRVSDPN